MTLASVAGRAVLVALVFMLVAPAAALAQSPPYSGFVEGGVGVFRQSGPTDTVSETYVTAPGGTTVGWSIGAGVTIGSHVSVLGEWATTGWMTAVEPSRYFTTYHEARRDRFVSVAARYSFGLASHIALEPLAGVVFTMEQATSQAVYTDPLVPRTAGPVVTHNLNTGIGPLIGVDVRAGSRRFAIIPSFRLLRTGISKGRYDGSPDSPEREIAAIYPGGFPTWTTRVGAMMQVRF